MVGMCVAAWALAKAHYPAALALGSTLVNSLFGAG
jgi:hypothetical protein